MSTPTRRRFLGWAAAVGLGAVVAACGGTEDTAEAPNEPIDGEPGREGNLRAVVSDLAGARRVGRLAVESPDVGRDAAALAAALAPAGVEPSAITDAPPAELLASTATRVREDFATDAVLDIGGWQLARTEAQLAGLLYLWR